MFDIITKSRTWHKNVKFHMYCVLSCNKMEQLLFLS